MCKVYHERKLYPWLTMASEYRRATDECAVPPLVIRIRAIRSHHIAQALQAHAIHVF